MYIFAVYNIKLDSMNKNLIFILFSMMLAPSASINTNAQNILKQIGQNLQQQYNSGDDEVYTQDRDHVYYRGGVLRDADARSFEFLGHGYAKDNWHVFYNGRILNGADPSTFILYEDADNHIVYRPNGSGRPGGMRPHRPDEGQGASNYGYTHDTFNAYYRGSKIDGASGSSFQVLTDGYAKDSFNAYFEGRKIEGSSGSSFQVLRGGYSRDSFNAFYYGRKIEGSSGSSFQVTEDGYAKDTFNTYYRGKKIN